MAEKEQNEKGKIFAQMVKILKEAKEISKDRENTSQKYKFRGIDDVYNSLHAIFAKHGVFTLPTVLEERSSVIKSSTGKNMIYRVLRIAYRFFADDGSFVSAIGVGEGMDTGDKAANKAMSAIHKYVLLQAFLIPTDEPKDSEEDSNEIGNGAEKIEKQPEKSAQKPPEQRTQKKTDDRPKEKQKGAQKATSEQDLMSGAKPPSKFDTAVTMTIAGKRSKISYAEALQNFQNAKKYLGNKDYYAVLGDAGFEKSDEIPFEKLDEIYKLMIDKYNAKRSDFR